MLPYSGIIPSPLPLGGFGNGGTFLVVTVATGIYGAGGQGHLISYNGDDCPIPWRLVQAQIPAVLPLPKLVAAKKVLGVLSEERFGSLETKDHFSRRSKDWGSDSSE